MGPDWQGTSRPRLEGRAKERAGMGQVHQEANAQRWMCSGFMRMSSQDQYKQGSGEGSSLGRGRIWAVLQSQEPQPTARWGVGESGAQMTLQNGPELGQGGWALISLHQPVTGYRLPQEGVWLQARQWSHLHLHFSQENSQPERPPHSASLFGGMESYSSSLGNTPQVLYKRPRERKENGCLLGARHYTCTSHRLLIPSAQQSQYHHAGKLRLRESNLPSVPSR